MREIAPRSAEAEQNELALGRSVSLMAERILIVEDDDSIATNLARALAANGYSATRSATGADALTLAPDSDLVLLDLGLPDIDGLEVCRQMREADATLPILMLTARQEEIDVVVGLDAGAVDYVIKPFRLAELLARIRAQLRRPETSHEPAQLVAGDLVVDRAARRVRVGTDEIDLRAKEFDLLAALVAQVGNVVTREQLMSEVWDEHWFGSTKTLDVHIAALRRKLDRGTEGQSRITTLRGVGYRFEAT
jgi:DNA-binding response OmpR family regulator